ncbi:Nonribosomal peptide synthetase 7 [Fusarium graminearum]
MPRSSSKLTKLQRVNSPKEQTLRKDKPTNGVFSDKPDDATLSVLDTIWFSIFTSNRAGVGMLASDELTPDLRYLPFYKVGGDLLDAAWFIALIQRRVKTSGRESNGDGILASHNQLTVDDVLRHPSVVEFAGLLKQKQVELN